MKKRSYLQRVFVAGMCCVAFASGWIGYRRNNQANQPISVSSQPSGSQSVEDVQPSIAAETKNTTKPKLVAIQLQSTPEMMNFRPGDRVDILTSIKRRDIPLVYDATILQSNSNSCMFLVPLSESKAVSQAIAEGKSIKLVPSSTGTLSDDHRPA